MFITERNLIMEKTNKVTKKMILSAIKSIMMQDPDGMVTEDVSAADVINYVDTTIAQIDARNEKAKVRQAEKRAASDTMASDIFNVLDNENFKTLDDIVATLKADGSYPDATNAQVSARTSKFVKDGTVVKGNVKLEYGRTVTGYKVA
jgi:hypothetical protein